MTAPLLTPVVALVGNPNAGKTSLFNTLSGFYKPQQGRVLLEGRCDQAPRARFNFCNSDGFVVIPNQILSIRWKS